MMNDSSARPRALDAAEHVARLLELLDVPLQGADEQVAVLEAAAHHWGVLRTMAAIMRQGPLMPFEEPAAVFRP
jgi:hypothetical protein